MADDCVDTGCNLPLLHPQRIEELKIHPDWVTEYETLELLRTHERWNNIGRPARYAL